MNMIKKLLLTGICAAAIMLLSNYALAVDSGGSVDVRSVRMIHTNVTLKVDQEKTLRTEVSPKDADDKTLDWSSSDPAIVSVDGDGVIKGISPGRARVTATSHNGKTAVCTVTVPDGDIEVRSVEMVTQTATVRVNQSRTLMVDILPGNADDKSIEWTSSNPEIALIDGDGVVIGVSPGTAEIMATAHNGKTAVCKVTVPAAVLTGIEQVQSKDIPSAQANAGTLSAAALKLDVENAVKDNPKSKQIALTYSGKSRVSTAALRSAAFTAEYNSREAVLRFRTLDENGKIQGQLTVKPQEASKDDMDIRLGVYTEAKQTGEAKTQASGYFKGTVAAVRLEHESSFDMTVQVAAKVDLTGIDPKAISIYRYAGGVYTLLKNRGYQIDTNGYIHFMVSEGGTYVLVSA